MLSEHKLLNRRMSINPHGMFEGGFAGGFAGWFEGGFEAVFEAVFEGVTTRLNFSFATAEPDGFFTFFFVPGLCATPSAFRFL